MNAAAQSPIIALEHLTAIDLPAPVFVSAAARAGFHTVGIRVQRPDVEAPPLLPARSPVLEETVKRLAHEGSRVLGVDVLLLHPATTRDRYLPVLELGAALGARFLTVIVDDPDLGRATGTFASLCQDAAAYSIRPLLEPAAYTCVTNVKDALRVVWPSVTGGVLIDSLHFHRFAGDPHELSDIPARLLPYIQLSDAPAIPPNQSNAPMSDLLRNEARTDRLPPGYGEIDLRALLHVFPPGRPVAVEVPSRRLRRQLSDHAYLTLLRESVEATLQLRTWTREHAA